MTGNFLKGREDVEIDGWPDNLALRVHRAISWIQRAEKEADDPDIAFTCYWIAFNAAYAEYTDPYPESRAREQFGEYFDELLGLDEAGTIYKAIWERFSGPIQELLDNRYVYEPFWRDVHRNRNSQRWRDDFERERLWIKGAIEGKHSRLILESLFSRLYVLRNQILHGGATWKGSINRKQVEDGAAIMGFLVPAFVKVMMDHPDKAWGANYYPRVG